MLSCPCIQAAAELCLPSEALTESDWQNPSWVLDRTSQVRDQRQEGAGHRGEPKGQVLSGEELRERDGVGDRWMGYAPSEIKCTIRPSTQEEASLMLLEARAGALGTHCLEECVRSQVKGVALTDSLCLA